MKENIKNFINKHYDMFVFVILFISIIGFSLNVKTIPGDEMWNFQNIYKMYNGYKMYIDANVITTPLFHVIGLVLFKILGANFFVFRLYNLFINLFLFFGVYRLFRILNIKKRYSFFFIILLLIIRKVLRNGTANYTTLAMVFVIYSIIIYINKKKYSNRKFILLESLFMILIFLTKQNIGLFYLMGFLFCYFIFEDKKDKIKDLIYIFLILCIAGISFLIILWYKGILNGFISFSFLGIGEFAQNNIWIDIKEAPLLLMPIINIVFVNILKKKNIGNKTIVINLEKVIYIAFPLLLIAYPIGNMYHITYALILQYVVLLSILYIIFGEIKFINKNINYLIYSFIIILSIISMIEVHNYIKKIKKDIYKDVFFGIIFDEETKMKINNVTKYIEESEKKIIVVSGDASLYMIPLKQNNGYFDEPLVGNFGKDGEDGVIKRILELDSTIILISEEKKNWQESDKVRNYIKNNFEYIGMIEDLQIYEIK